MRINKEFISFEKIKNKNQQLIVGIIYRKLYKNGMSSMRSKVCWNR